MKFIIFILLAALAFSALVGGSASAATPLPANPRYAALGDSVAAGAGLPTTGLSTDVLCGRSSSAYPYQVAATLNASVTSFACSGAKVNKGLYGSQVRRGSVLPAQIDQAFSTGKPDLITMTIGANDARWIEFMTKCYITTCGTRFDNAAARVLRADLRIELSVALYRIKQYSNASENTTPPKVLVGGYYTPLSTAECVGSNRITPTEVSWIKSQTNSLNQALRSVTPYFSYAQYVPVSFSGHELCSDDSWVQGINGVAPLHPTAEGQTAIAQSFVNAVYR